MVQQEKEGEERGGTWGEGGHGSGCSSREGSSSRRRRRKVCGGGVDASEKGPLLPEWAKSDNRADDTLLVTERRERGRVVRCCLP